MRQSRKPFGEELEAILREQDVSQRELVRRCKDNGWGSLWTINALVHGELRPTMPAIEAVSRTLHVRPEHFAEYRLAEARRWLDPEEVGVESALRYLARLD